MVEFPEPGFAGWPPGSDATFPHLALLTRPSPRSWGHRGICFKSYASVMAPSVSSPSYQLLEFWARRARAHLGTVASAAPAIAFPLSSPPVSCFRPWSAQSRHTMPSEETASLSKDAWSESRPLACERLHWLHRPGDGTSGEAPFWRSEFSIFSSMRRDARAQLRFRPSEIHGLM